MWVEVMGLMHDSDQYGQLRWPLKEIAQALGAPLKLVQELATKGVMKGRDKGVVEAFVYTPRTGRRDLEPKVLVDAQDGPLWYSSRMVKDEHLRSVRGEQTRFEGDPKPTPKAAPKVGLGATSSDGSTSSSTTTSPSLRSGEDPPKVSAVSLKTYLERCRQAECKPIPPEHPIRAYCADAGINDEMLQVAWLMFKDRHTTGEKVKRYKDWPRVFQNSVESRWYGLWIIGDEGAAWSSTGMQQKRVLEARMRKAEEQHAPA